jgi:signal transduction histidine kinase
MSDPLTILLNGLTLSLAFGLQIIVLWNNYRKDLNQYFALFLFAVIVWHVGSLLGQVAQLATVPLVFVQIASVITELGFAASSISLFALSVILVRQKTKYFQWFLLLAFAVVFAYRILLIVIENRTMDGMELLLPEVQPLLLGIYITFDMLSLFLMWRYRQKIRSRGIIIGCALFVIGQSLGFLNPELQVFPFSMFVSSLAVLVMSFSILRSEILDPLTIQSTQVESLHRVSLAISSQIAIETVLSEIAKQAASWLQAEAVGIWLLKEGRLELAAVYDLPHSFIAQTLAIGQGVVGTVAQTRQPLRLSNYGREWQGEVDVPYARETFGSVLASPLQYGDDIIGVILVIASMDGRVFEKEDGYLLELLTAQASVAIANSQLFAEQQSLASEIEVSRSQMETVLNNTHNPVIAIDQTLEKIFSNPSANELLKDKTFSDMIHEKLGIKDVIRLEESTQKRNNSTTTLTFGERTYTCSISRLQSNKVEGWVVVLNEITELIELDRMKSEMIRMTSHDLKNPLQAAIANIELLREDTAPMENDEVKHSVNVIEAQLERMNRIISGILDLEKAKTTEKKFESISVKRLVSEATDEVQHLFDEKKIAVHHEVGESVPEFEGDYEQIKRAIVNLLENAAKFSYKDGRITVKAIEADDALAISVEDNGIGIPAEAQSQIFNRFYRVNQPGTEHISGSGLGLNLVKTIIENHKGSITVRSELGHGTRFDILLPIKQQQKL